MDLGGLYDVELMLCPNATEIGDLVISMFVRPNSH